jgi:hypothetical protein
MVGECAHRRMCIMKVTPPTDLTYPTFLQSFLLGQPKVFTISRSLKHTGNGAQFLAESLVLSFCHFVFSRH